MHSATRPARERTLDLDGDGSQPAEGVHRQETRQQNASHAPSGERAPGFAAVPADQAAGQEPPAPDQHQQRDQEEAVMSKGAVIDRVEEDQQPRHEAEEQEQRGRPPPVEGDDGRHQRRRHPYAIDGLRLLRDQSHHRHEPRVDGEEDDGWNRFQILLQPR